MNNIIKPKKAKERIVFYLEPEKKIAIKKVAIDNNTSLSDVMASLVSNYLENVK